VYRNVLPSRTHKYCTNIHRERCAFTPTNIIPSEAEESRIPLEPSTAGCPIFGAKRLRWVLQDLRARYKGRKCTETSYRAGRIKYRTNIHRERCAFTPQTSFRAKPRNPCIPLEPPTAGCPIFGAKRLRWVLQDLRARYKGRKCTETSYRAGRIKYCTNIIPSGAHSPTNVIPSEAEESLYSARTANPVKPTPTSNQTEHSS
jgi:hypothetical protein